MEQKSLSHLVTVFFSSQCTHHYITYHTYNHTMLLICTHSPRMLAHTHETRRARPLLPPQKSIIRPSPSSLHVCSS